MISVRRETNVVSLIIALEYCLKAISRLQCKSRDSKQPGDLDEFGRQKLVYRKATVTRICWRVHQREESCSETKGPRELQKGSFEFGLSNDLHIRGNCLRLVKKNNQ